MVQQRTKPLVLVADDDPELVGILVKRLQLETWDVITATDGAEAFERVVADRPDVVVLDVMMPKMNGWEVCKAIRQSRDPEVSSTGVVMLTGIGEKLNEITSPLYGADEHLDKPFSFPDLIVCLKRLVNSRRR